MPGGNVSIAIAAALYHASLHPPLPAGPSESASPTVTLSAATRPLHEAPLAVSAAVLAVCILCPLIVSGNALLLGAVYRFKRLRTPSNYLVAALAASDLGIGLLLPVGLYLEITRTSARALAICLLPYCLAISLGTASLCAMAAIAADRFTSLAQPLRYNNLITHTSVERYIAAFWGYALLVGFSPFYDPQQPLSSEEAKCTFTSISSPVQVFLVSAVYVPCALVLLICYGYIYVVARYHARAIYTVEISLRQPHNATPSTSTAPPTPAVASSNQSRYGQTLAFTVGLFLTLWLPFIVCMLLDLTQGSHLLDQDWVGTGLALPIFASSGLNPWVYGYHNTEVRIAVQRVLDEVLTRLGLGHGSACRESAPVPTDVNSFASNARLCAVSPLHQQTGGHHGQQVVVRTLPVPRRDTLECSTVGSAARETVVHLEIPPPSASLF